MGKSKDKQLVITAEKVIDRNGQIIASRPEDVPAVAGAVKIASAAIRTGQNYRIVDSKPGGVA